MSVQDRRQFLKAALGATAALPALAATAKAGGHATHQIEITEFSFQPIALKMEAGDKVRFVNLDSAPHTATADKGAFNTGRLNRGGEETIVIERPGTYSFFCEFHPGMRGEIIAS